MACSGCGSTTPSNPPSSASTPAPHTPNKALYKEPHDHLKFDNEVTMINAEVIEHIARMYVEGTLLKEIDKIPIIMRPKGTEHISRCCIHCDRAMIRYRIIATLGLDVAGDTDEELTPLSAFAERALSRKKEEVVEPVLTVIQEACHKCARQQYIVTDACQKCLARPCAVNCPAGAITHQDNRAQIDPNTCKRCGLCMKVCPYHAIINIPIPCVSVCPVGAISLLPDGVKKFDFDKCIFCGNCQRACPFGAVMPKSQMIDVLKALSDTSKPVVALLAPAIIGHSKVDVATLATGLVQGLGFRDVIDVSVGADTCAQLEAKELNHVRSIRSSKGKPDFMTTSCCPAYVNCIKKHIPELEDAISSTRSPLHYSAVMAKEKYPDCTAVFIGPCVAKRQEAIRDEVCDYTLTFVEVFAMLHAKKVNLTTLPPMEKFVIGSKEGRGFPVSGGVSAAVKSFIPPEMGDVQPILINGLNPNSVKLLRAYAKKPPHGNLIEVMACEGGCIAGPATASYLPIASAKVKVAVAKTPHHPSANPNTVTPYVPPTPSQ